MKLNLVVLLADLFLLFEIHPAKCVCYPGMDAPGKLHWVHFICIYVAIAIISAYPLVFVYFYFLFFFAHLLMRAPTNMLEAKRTAKKECKIWILWSCYICCFFRFLVYLPRTFTFNTFALVKLHTISFVGQQQLWYILLYAKINLLKSKSLLFYFFFVFENLLIARRWALS